MKHITKHTSYQVTTSTFCGTKRP